MLPGHLTKCRCSPCRNQEISRILPLALACWSAVWESFEQTVHSPTTVVPGKCLATKRQHHQFPTQKKKLWEYIGNDVLYLKTVKAEKLGEQSCNSYLTWNHCHLTGRLTWLPRQSWAVSCKLQRRRTGVMNFWTVILNRKGVQDGSRMLVVVSTSQFHIGFNFFA